MRTQPGRLKVDWSGRVLDEDWLLGAEDPTGQGNGAHNGRGWPWEPADRRATGLLEPVIDGAGVRPPIKKEVARMVEDTGPLHPATLGDRRYLLSRGLDPDDLAPEPGGSTP